MAPLCLFTLSAALVSQHATRPFLCSYRAPDAFAGVKERSVALRSLAFVRSVEEEKGDDASSGVKEGRNKKRGRGDGGGSLDESGSDEGSGSGSEESGSDEESRWGESEGADGDSLDDDGGERGVVDGGGGGGRVRKGKAKPLTKAEASRQAAAEARNRELPDTVGGCFSARLNVAAVLTLGGDEGQHDGGFHLQVMQARGEGEMTTSRRSRSK